jgi:hypothetical protein
MADNDYVNESSGVVASQLSADVYWTHNDSGNDPFVYAFRLNEADKAAGVIKHLGHVELDNVNAGGDWEDIARGTEDYLYIFDGGDNSAIRSDKRIFRFPEPTIDPDGEVVVLSLTPELIWFEYPDPDNPTAPATDHAHRYDAESLFVHPSSGDLYIVTKSGPNGVAARVYVLPNESLSWNSSGIHVLQFVADITNKVGMATAADIAPDGRRVVIRNYFTAYEFITPPSTAFDAIFDHNPTHTIALLECQGEAICYDAHGRNLITTSEARLEFFCPSRMPVYEVPAVNQ